MKKRANGNGKQIVSVIQSIILVTTDNDCDLLMTYNIHINRKLMLLTSHKTPTKWHESKNGRIYCSNLENFFKEILRQLFWQYSNSFFCHFFYLSPTSIRFVMVFVLYEMHVAYSFALHQSCNANKLKFTCINL